MPASTVTMPEARRIAQLYEAGQGTPTVAQAVGRSRKAVRTVLRQLGVQMRDPSDAQAVRVAPRSRHAAWQRRCNCCGQFVHERLSAVPVSTAK